MGENLFCDLCGLSVPLRDNLQKIILGDKEVAEVCFNCASQLKSSMNVKKMEVMEAMKHPAPVPKEPEQPTEPRQPAQAEIPAEAEHKASTGRAD